jgi:hypothetical protein
LGGTIGIAWVNMTAHGSPVFGIAGGAIAGWVVAAVLSRVLAGGRETGLIRTSDTETKRD